MAEDALNAIDTTIQAGAIGLAAGTALVAGTSKALEKKMKKSKKKKNNNNNANTKIHPSSMTDNDVSLMEEGKVTEINTTNTRKKKPRRIQSRIKSFRNRQTTEFSKKNPYTSWCLSMIRPSFVLIMFYLDVFADINMTYNLSHYPPIQWAFYIMLTFLLLQGSSALFGINYYAAITFEKEYVKRGLILLFSPLLVLMFDSLMIFYRPFEIYLPDQLVIFMVQYEALRKISEFVLETIPQTILQISLFFICIGNICGFDAQEKVSTY